jgi:hypothetical protein
MRCPQSRPATISCRQTMAMSKPSGGAAAGIGAAGGAGERSADVDTYLDAKRAILAQDHTAVLELSPTFGR